MSLNNMVRTDGSGSAAQMLFGCMPRSSKFGLVTPARVDRDQLAEARSKSHRDMRSGMKGNRKLEHFMKNDRIILQDDNTGHFDQKVTVVGPSDRRADDRKTFHIRKDQTGEVLLRNKIHFRRLPVEGGESRTGSEDRESSHSQQTLPAPLLQVSLCRTQWLTQHKSQHSLGHRLIILGLRERQCLTQLQSQWSPGHAVSML